MKAVPGHDRSASRGVDPLAFRRWGATPDGSTRLRFGFEALERQHVPATSRVSGQRHSHAVKARCSRRSSTLKLLLIMAPKASRH